jgi:hypothetical protein
VKTRKEVFEEALRKFGLELQPGDYERTELMKADQEEIDFLVDRSLAGKAIPAGDNRYKIQVGAFHLPKTEEVLEHIQRAVEVAANEALAFAVKETAYFWLRRDGGLKGTMYIPLGNDCDEPEWTVDLEREFKEFLEDRMYPDTATLDPKGFVRCKEIRDKLADIVGLYDEVLNKGADHRKVENE